MKCNGNRWRSTKLIKSRSRRRLGRNFWCVVVRIMRWTNAALRCAHTQELVPRRSRGFRGTYQHAGCLSARRRTWGTAAAAYIVVFGQMLNGNTKPSIAPRPVYHSSASICFVRNEARRSAAQRLRVESTSVILEVQAAFKGRK